MHTNKPASANISASMLLILTSMPDQVTANSLAEYLVRENLAACVHIGAAGHSVYIWQNTLETTTELPLTIKTTPACHDAVMAAIRARHPYELPEILCVPVTAADPAYLLWVSEQTKQTVSS